MAGDDPGQPLLQAVVQRQPPLGGQLQYHGGDEGLGDAAHAHLVLRLHGLAGGLVGQAGHHVRDLLPAPGHHDHAGHAVRDQLVGGPLQTSRWLAGNRQPGNPLVGLGSDADADVYAGSPVAISSAAVTTPMIRSALGRGGLPRELMSHLGLVVLACCIYELGSSSPRPEGTRVDERKRVSTTSRW